MIDAINSFIDNTVQCWGCGVFDRLFGVVSTVAAEIYVQMTNLAFIIFFALFTAFVVNAMKNSFTNSVSKVPTFSVGI